MKKTLKNLYNSAKTELIIVLRRLSAVLLSIWCLYSLYVWFAYGFLWFFLMLVTTGAVLFIVFRSYLMLAIRSIEMKVWGKPLDKTYWKDEKPPKLKFVWNKKGDNKK